MNTKTPSHHSSTPPGLTHNPVPQFSQPIQPAKRDVGLILAIIFASSVISGSLVFFGMQVTGKGAGGSDIEVAKIETAFENFVQKQQNKQQQDQQQAQADKDKQAAALAKNVPKVVSADHVRGDRNAKYSFIEYSDFECPYCKRFHPVAKQVFEAYGGRMNWVYRHYPLPFHDPMASFEAQGSECANELGGNDKFWAYADAVYEKTNSGGNGLSEEDVWTIAGDIGLNKASFQTCIKSGKYLRTVKDDSAGGEKAGVNGTPGNIILNNETGDVTVVEGAQPFDSFKKALDVFMK